MLVVGLSASLVVHYKTRPVWMDLQYVLRYFYFCFGIISLGALFFCITTFFFYQQVFLVFVPLFFLHITIGRGLLLLTPDRQYWLQWHTMLLFGVWVTHVSWANRLIRCPCCYPSIYFCFFFFFSISQDSSILEKLILLSKWINEKWKKKKHSSQ